MLCSVVAAFTVGSAVVLASGPSVLVPEAASTQRSWVPTADMRVCALGKGKGQSGVWGVFSQSWGKKALSRGASQTASACPLQTQG